MGRLAQAWASVTRYLGQLGPKDKALIGSLVVAGALVLVLVGVWSSRPEMSPLMPDLGPAEQASAAAALSEADIEHRMVNGKVAVAPEKKLYAIAYLQQAGKLPENTQSLFSALARTSNWMSSRTDSDRLANAALCEVLSGVVSKFNGVESATVMIDAPEPTGMGASYRKPSASVGVLMKAGRSVDRAMVEAIAAMVSGAKAGLAMADVKVIDQRANQQYSPRTAGAVLGGASGSGDYMELMLKHEEHMQRKVSQLISRFDPLSMVTVSVQADNTTRRTTTKEFLADGKGSVAVAESSTVTEGSDKSGGANSGGAPGVVSNVAADAVNGSGSAGGTASVNNSSTDKFKVGLGEKMTDVVSPGGQATRISVMVSLSREYIGALIKQRKGAQAAGAGGEAQEVEPTQSEIETAFIAEKSRIEKDLGPVVQTAAVEVDASMVPRVTVSLIPIAQVGLGGMGLGGGTGGQQASLGGGGLVGQIASGPVVKTAAIGVLACVALGMMLMLVRKSSKPQNLPTPEEMAGLPPLIDSGDDVVGEADEGATAMEGIELGEAQIRTKKMLESIQEQVKKSPGDAANLINRWMNVER